MASRRLFRQLFDKESSTYTYLLADMVAREAILIDPVIEQVWTSILMTFTSLVLLCLFMFNHCNALTNIVWDQAERDVGLVRQLGLNLQFVLNTHVHADHITGTGERWNTSKLVPSPSYLSIKFKMIIINDMKGVWSDSCQTRSPWSPRRAGQRQTSWSLRETLSGLRTRKWSSSVLRSFCQIWRGRGCGGGDTWTHGGLCHLCPF